ncbi:hypothetical protein [Vibrio algicola]|uniref:Uncharacterized protein n=1 Tax=Vibrio algicola TaxID=2662262 RepID=A0A5Q0TIQ2_9VIBR|nr:hypothetical protein [Vibrio algicola]
MQNIDNQIISSDMGALDSFLQEKGVSIDHIKHAVSEAVIAFNSTTSDEPARYRGYTITAKATLALRQSLKSLGFKKEAPHNIELTANSDNKFAIHICRGDEQAGISSGYPSTMRAKGPRSQEFFGLITSDISQIDMFPEDLPDYSLNNCPFDVWFLLLNAEKKIGRVGYQSGAIETGFLFSKRFR